MHRLVVKMFHFFIDLDLVRIALFSAKKWGVALYVMKTGLRVTWSTTQFLPQVHTANTNVIKILTFDSKQVYKDSSLRSSFSLPTEPQRRWGSRTSKIAGVSLGRELTPSDQAFQCTSSAMLAGNH